MLENIKGTQKVRPRTVGATISLLFLFHTLVLSLSEIPHTSRQAVIDTVSLSRGAEQRWRFFALFAKNTTPLPLDGLKLCNSKIEKGVVLCALSENNTLTTPF